MSSAVCQEIIESSAIFLLQQIDINDQLVHVYLSHCLGFS